MGEHGKKLNIGCGLNTPQDWINIDGSWNAWLVKYPLIRETLKSLRLLPESQLAIPWSPNILVRDVRKPLPFKDNSIMVIYSSHLLEHLYFEETKRLLKECFRVLIPGGIIRAVVPDLKSVVLEYIGNGISQDSSAEIGEDTPADILNRRLLLRPPRRHAGNIFYKIYAIIFDFHTHKWMYDAQSLIKIFQRAGFENVHEKQLHNSRIMGIEAVEKAEKILNGAGVCVEGNKPGITPP